MTVWAISSCKNILHQTCFHNACDRRLRQTCEICINCCAESRLCVYAGRTGLSEDARGRWTWFLIHFSFSYNTIPHWQSYSSLGTIQRINKIINQKTSHTNASTASFYNWSCSFHTELIVILLIRGLGIWDCWEGCSSF